MALRCFRVFIFLKPNAVKYQRRHKMVTRDIGGRVGFEPKSDRYPEQPSRHNGNISNIFHFILDLDTCTNRTKGKNSFYSVPLPIISPS